MHNRRARIIRRAGRVVVYLILLAATLICIFPFLWMVSTAFKTMAEVYRISPTFIPHKPTLENFSKGWAYADFTTFTKNTVFVALTATVGTVISSSLVGYGFARFRSRLSGLLETVLLGTMILPVQITLIPQYLLFNKLGWIDTYWPLIVPSWLGGGAFNIFLFIQFFKTLPKELDEAATIDGANSFQVYTQIMLPAVRPVLLAVTVMSLVYHWRDFFLPLVYLNSMNKYTISIGLQFFQSAYGNVRIGMMMAVSLLALVPVLVIFALAQRYFIQGIKLSGLKG